VEKKSPRTDEISSRKKLSKLKERTRFLLSKTEKNTIKPFKIGNDTVVVEN